MKSEIQTEVQRCALEIKKICPEARIIVFGSSVDEAVLNPRDIDLLIVVPKSVDFKPTRRKILAIPRTTWPLDIVVVPDDFLKEKLRLSGNFYAFICNEGVEIGTQQNVSA
jgi:hypothetical protein